MAKEFWLSDRQWAVLEPLIPMHQGGVKPKRNREIISGIVPISRSAAVGATVRRCMARTPRSTIGSTDG